MFKQHCDLHATDHSMKEVLVTVVLYNTDTVTAVIILFRFKKKFKKSAAYILTRSF